MPSSILREILSGMSFAISLFIIISFVVYLYRVQVLYPNFLAWLKESQTALAILIFMTGNGIIHGTMWYTQHLYNHEHDLIQFESAVTTSIIIGMALTLVGGLMKVKEFSPQFLRPWSWVSALIISIMFGVWIYYSYVSRWGFVVP